METFIHIDNQLVTVGADTTRADEKTVDSRALTNFLSLSDGVTTIDVYLSRCKAKIDPVQCIFAFDAPECVATWVTNLDLDGATLVTNFEQQLTGCQEEINLTVVNTLGGVMCHKDVTWDTKQTCLQELVVQFKRLAESEKYQQKYARMQLAMKDYVADLKICLDECTFLEAFLLVFKEARTIFSVILEKTDEVKLMYTILLDGMLSVVCARTVMIHEPSGKYLDALPHSDQLKKLIKQYDEVGAKTLQCFPVWMFLFPILGKRKMSPFDLQAKPIFDRFLEEVKLNHREKVEEIGKSLDSAMEEFKRDLKEEQFHELMLYMGCYITHPSTKNNEKKVKLQQVYNYFKRLALLVRTPEMRDIDEDTIRLNQQLIAQMKKRKKYAKCILGNSVQTAADVYFGKGAKCLTDYYSCVIPISAVLISFL
ncbi:hypothetical protein Ciccas_011364 [Cichlidogyrus casuarinus]|uniref:Uncharacterized protein n=1 Tax=Cichlidogyrus casuarinus TaxID=1844966 RepID=A0ABD2PUD4_9PLAT